MCCSTAPLSKRAGLPRRRQCIYIIPPTRYVPPLLSPSQPHGLPPSIVPYAPGMLVKKQTPQTVHVASLTCVCLPPDQNSAVRTKRGKPTDLAKFGSAVVVKDTSLRASFRGHGCQKEKEKKKKLTKLCPGVKGTGYLMDDRKMETVVGWSHAWLFRRWDWDATGTLL